MKSKILQTIEMETGKVFAEGSVVRRQPFYDKQTFTSASTTSLSFFGSTSANRGVGNVIKNNSIGRWFYLKGIRLLIIPATGPSITAASATVAPKMLSDIWLLTCSSDNYLELLVNNNPELQLGPIVFFPAGAGLSGFAALNNTQAAAADGHTQAVYGQAGTPLGKDVFTLEPGILIQPEDAIGLTLTWPAALTLSGNAVIKAYLDGYTITTPSKRAA
jgi:hypothetical protein